MKYPRGTVLKWTAKAMNPNRKKVGCGDSGKLLPSDRMIVLDKQTMIIGSNGVIDQLDYWKSRDSFVEPSGDSVSGWKVCQTEVDRCNGAKLVKEFSLRIVERKS